MLMGLLRGATRPCGSPDVRRIFFPSEKSEESEQTAVICLISE